MLDTHWRQPADLIAAWLDTQFPASHRAGARFASA